MFVVCALEEFKSKSSNQRKTNKQKKEKEKAEQSNKLEKIIADPKVRAQQAAQLAVSNFAKKLNANIILQSLSTVEIEDIKESLAPKNLDQDNKLGKKRQWLVQTAVSDGLLRREVDTSTADNSGNSWKRYNYFIINQETLKEIVCDS